MRQPLKDLAAICAGQGAPQGDHNYCENGTPFIKAGNLQELLEGKAITSIQKVSDEVAKKHKLRLYPKGTILFAKSGMSCIKGYIYVLPQSAYVVSHLACITPNEDISEYLRYYFNYHKPNQLVKDAAYPSISLSDVGNLVVDMKPESERNEIVSVLQHTESIITLRQQQLQKLNELVKARFVELFGTLHNNGNGFDVVTIADVCSLIKDGTHQTPQYTDNKETGYKFLSSKDVMSQKIDWTDIKYIPAELHEKLYATIKPQRNDILMSKNGVNYGIAAVNDTDEVFDIYVSLALLRPKELIAPVFLRCAINNPETKRQFDSSIKGIGVPNLHLGEIKKTKIFLPPMELQKEFVSFVEQTDKSKAAVQKALDEAQMLFDSLMQKYFG